MLSRKYCGRVLYQSVGWDLSAAKGETAVIGVSGSKGTQSDTTEVDVYKVDLASASSGWIDSFAAVGGVSDDTSDFFGFALDFASDVDGDGYADLAVGAPGATPVGSEFSAGRAFIYSGPFPDARDLAAYDAVLDGYGLMNQFGAEVSALPDIDGDGDDELLVGTYANSNYAHMAQLFLGPLISESRLEADASYERAYTSSGDNLEVADMDGDGVAEILNLDESLDVDTAGGVVFIVPSDLRGTIDLNDQMGVFGEEDRKIYGSFHGLATGDATGDGYDDIVVQVLDRRSGSYLMTVLQFAGPITSSVTLDAAAAEVTVWSELESISPRVVGDVDGDGHSGDVVVGLNHSGAVFLLPRPLTGALTLTDADVIVRGEPYTDTLGDMFGFSLAPLPDLDGDGADELLIAAPRNDEGGTDAGAVYLLYGASW